MGIGSLGHDNDSVAGMRVGVELGGRKFYQMLRDKMLAWLGIRSSGTRANRVANCAARHSPPAPDNRCQSQLVIA